MVPVAEPALRVATNGAREGDERKIYVALLRGINVLGKRMLPMKELVAILEAIGGRNVATYIQSGNAVFWHRDGDAAKLAGKVGAAVAKRRGFRPHVLVLEARALEQAAAKNPFRGGVGPQSVLLRYRRKDRRDTTPRKCSISKSYRFDGGRR